MPVVVSHCLESLKEPGEPARRCVPSRLRFRLNGGKPLQIIVNAALLMILGLALTARAPIQAQKPGFHENAVKAVYLFNFAQFVEWPAQAFSTPSSPLVIGVLGDDPFGQLLDQTVNREVVKRHELTVQRYRRVEEIGACHVLFISRSEARNLEAIFVKLQGRPILTVGDYDDFAARGGMIRFITADNRVRMRINLGVAKAAGLTISSNLLRPAEIVDTRRNP